ncbi:MAG: septal ring lytic transglycosylase RlpA family protein [Myxococcota bacterium]
MLLVLLSCLGGGRVLQTGQASFYGEGFAGRPTASGAIFDPSKLTAAHRTLPLGTVVDVIHQRTGARVRVIINDRGPFAGNRIVDLSQGAAERLGMVAEGVARVELRLVQCPSGETCRVQ